MISPSSASLLIEKERTSEESVQSAYHASVSTVRQKYKASGSSSIVDVEPPNTVSLLPGPPRAASWSPVWNRQGDTTKRISCSQDGSTILAQHSLSKEEILPFKVIEKGQRDQDVESPIVHTSGNVPVVMVTQQSLPIDEVKEATWNDVCRACCIHSAREWVRVCSFMLCLVLILYLFLIGLDLLGTSFKVVGGCTAGALLGSDTNPLASVMIGIIATALLQSSSTTTAVIVSLVSGGLDVQQGIYMVMGANVGTSITSMLVALAHAGDGEELERAFAGSSVLYIFNFFTAVLLLPIEITTKYLYHLTKPMLPTSAKDGESWEGPVKKVVNPIVKSIIIANKDLIDRISTGDVASCSSPGIYPVQCSGGIEEDEYCYQVGVIACDSTSGKCPIFFQNEATKKDDMVSGWVCLVIAMVVLIGSLLALVGMLRKLLLGTNTRLLYRATNIPPLAAIIVGCGVTVLAQSSSVTTSALVPLAGVGVLSLEAMYPLVLGADIGTTFTAVMAAMVSSTPESLQIAFVHFFFNITGAVVFYMIPFTRRLVLKTAKLCGRATGQWKGFPIFFILVMFICFPLVLLLISSLFEAESKGYNALGGLLVLLLVGFIIYAIIWWKFYNGGTKFKERIEHRRRRAAAISGLADDLDYMKVDLEWTKNEIGRLKDFASQLETAPMTLDEGRHQVVVVTTQPSRGYRSQGNLEEDDQISVFQSCRSKPWKDILYAGASSIKSSLGGGSMVPKARSPSIK